MGTGGSSVVDVGVAVEAGAVAPSASLKRGERISMTSQARSQSPVLRRPWTVPRPVRRSVPGAIGWAVPSR